MPRQATRTNVVFLLFVILCMHGSVAHAYSDVADPALEQALTDLSRFEIISGYPDGSFHPLGQITRAEFAKVIISTTKPDLEEFALGDSSFSDVSTSHWAYPLIMAAKTLGIINGYPDGTFRPNDGVTYEQAIKMIVCAVNYGDVAIDNGGYPDGYLTVAAALGIGAGLEFRSQACAKRGDIALIVWDALNVPLRYLDFCEEGLEYVVSPETLFDVYTRTYP